MVKNIVKNAPKIKHLLSQTIKIVALAGERIMVMKMHSPVANPTFLEMLLITLCFVRNKLSFQTDACLLHVAYPFSRTLRNLDCSRALKGNCLYYFRSFTNYVISRGFQMLTGEGWLLIT